MSGSRPTQVLREMSGPEWESAVAVTISVKSFTGSNRSYTVKPSDTVHDLKVLILNKEGIPLDQQRLIFGGFELEDGQTMWQVGVEEGSVMHQSLRLRGD